MSTCWDPNFPHHLLKKLSFLLGLISVPLWKMCGLFFSISILFCWTIGLFCQFQAVWYLKSGTIIPLVFSLLYNIAFTIWSSLFIYIILIYMYIYILIIYIISHYPSRYENNVIDIMITCSHWWISICQFLYLILQFLILILLPSSHIPYWSCLFEKSSIIQIWQLNINLKDKS